MLLHCAVMGGSVDIVQFLLGTQARIVLYWIDVGLASAAFNAARDNFLFCCCLASTRRSTPARTAESN